MGTVGWVTYPDPVPNQSSVPSELSQPSEPSQPSVPAVERAYRTGGGPRPYAARRGVRPGVVVSVALAAGIMGGLGGGVVGAVLSGSKEATAPAAVQVRTVADPGSETALSVADIAARVQPAVVELIVVSEDDEATGSGFIIRSDGYILTNNHVAGGDGGEITVVMSDGSRLPGKLVGADPGYDLAVVKVDGKGLPTVDLGSSSALRVGDGVIAVGSPLGLRGTVTTGIVSSLDRPVSAGGADGEASFINAIQTDAAINPGNSGGPLLDSNGAVVGVNSAIATLGVSEDTSSGSIGLGFAIPIDTADRVAREIIATGKSSTPLLEVRLDGTFEGSGARLLSVTKDGAADRAGLKPGDVVVGVNGDLVEDPTDLVVTVRSYAPGDVVRVSVDRDGQEKTFEVTLSK